MMEPRPTQPVSSDAQPASVEPPPPAAAEPNYEPLPVIPGSIIHVEKGLLPDRWLIGEPDEVAG
jgi:hypothetical protein